ncbi:MAG TPA: ComEA family DNA-binding protein [Candidatus Competibacteraceae bacterium]|nr:ComEA family DNA-binding protein [Candidatus Competibacteraceae bacterium]
MFKPIRQLLAAAALSLSCLTAIAAGPVNINTATVEELAQGLQGVGPKKAAAIVAYREQHGPFKSIDQLGEVTGIGEKLVESNRNNMTVGEPATADAQIQATQPQ